jgi:hypothetical protein
MISRYGSHALAAGARPGRGGHSAAESVDTSLAGFAPESVDASLAGFAPGSVDVSLAGFGGRRPHDPGGRTAIPAALR